MLDSTPRTGWSALQAPDRWIPLLVILFAIVGSYFTMRNDTANNAQNLADFKTQIVQTIDDMKANQLPKRVQTLEDQFAANQQAQQSQFQATQSAITALQVSLQSASVTQSSAMHDVTVQLGSQSQQIASMSAQIQYYLAQPDPRRK
jgi:predicted PurR-regulated permease PerM